MEAPPITEFKDLKIVTMTVIARLMSCRLNLAAIFCLLPVTNRTFPINEKRNTKVKYPPGFNVPGEIMSVTFQNQLRGIRRSKNVSSFPNGIIIDIGTSKKIVNLKLAPSIEVTGVTSPELAREVFEDIIQKVMFLQKAINTFQGNPELTQRVIQNLKLWKAKNGFMESPVFDDSTDAGVIEKFFAQLTNFCNSEQEFMDKCEQILTLRKNIELYTGNLDIKEIEYPMTNTCFDIGFHINRTKFATLINTHPFECNFSNAADSSSDSAVQVIYAFDKYNATTGKTKRAKHTIRVNKSGYTTHSSPDRSMSEAVYYTFRKKVNEIWKTAMVAEGTEQTIKTAGDSQIFTTEEYEKILQKQKLMNEKIQQSQVPILPEHTTAPVIKAPEVEEGPAEASLPEFDVTFSELCVF